MSVPIVIKTDLKDYSLARVINVDISNSRDFTTFIADIEKLAHKYRKPFPGPCEAVEMAGQMQCTRCGILWDLDDKDVRCLTDSEL